MSSHEHLSAASNDRKARLAQLKSLKRKQAPSDDIQDASTDAANATALTATATTTTTTDEEPSVVTTYLSGRNFDPATRNVKLGFENTPIADQTRTLEYKAQQLALETKAEQDRETSDAPLDLFRLQPKKPNWDLKRDLDVKLREGGLAVATENAVARLVRERVEAQRQTREQQAVGGSGGAQENGGDGQEVGMEGGELVEAMHQREAEEERERRRDEEDDVEG